MSAEDKKIDLMIIGAQKAGTTSLLKYLGEHPEICAHETIEFSYFYDNEEFSKGFETAIRTHFGKIKNNCHRMVAKHAHLYTSAEGLHRLKEHNPDCKIVFVLREPVARAYSSYLMERLYNRVDFEFEELPEIMAQHPERLKEWQREAILEFGYYDKYVEQLYALFPRENILLFKFEEFAKDPIVVVRKLFRLIEVDGEYFPRVRVVHNETAIPRSKLMATAIKKMLVEENPVKKVASAVLPTGVRARLGKGIRNVNRGKTDQKPGIAPAVKEYLRNHYKEHNEKLAQITEMDVKNW